MTLWIVQYSFTLNNIQCCTQEGLWFITFPTLLLWALKKNIFIHIIIIAPIFRMVICFLSVINITVNLSLEVGCLFFNLVDQCLPRWTILPYLLGWLSGSCKYDWDRLKYIIYIIIYHNFELSINYW